MKNFRITENDKKYITDLYKSKNIFLEQTVATGSDTASTTPLTASTTNYTMKQLQDLILTKGGDLGRFGADGKYGNWTANAILKLLGNPVKEQPKPEETQQNSQQPTT